MSSIVQVGIVQAGCMGYPVCVCFPIKSSGRIEPEIVLSPQEKATVGSPAAATGMQLSSRPPLELVRASGAPNAATDGKTDGKTSVRGAPSMDRGAAGPQELARQYDKLANSKKEKVLSYAERVVKSCGPPPCSRGADGMLEIVITEDARATLDELQDSISVVMPEVGIFATCLNRRGPRACRVPPDESFRVVMHDGAIVAELHRNEIPSTLAAGWTDIEEYHRTHADMWGLGCEAEPTTNLERTAAAFRTAKGAAGYAIQKGMTVHNFAPRGGHVGNKLTVTYTNRDGRTVKNFGIGGCPIERHKYSFDIFERMAPRGAELLKCLVRSYERRVVSFMESKSFPATVMRLTQTRALPNAPTTKHPLFPHRAEGLPYWASQVR